MVLAIAIIIYCIYYGLFLISFTSLKDVIFSVALFMCKLWGILKTYMSSNMSTVEVVVARTPNSFFKGTRLSSSCVGPQYRWHVNLNSLSPSPLSFSHLSSLSSLLSYLSPPLFHSLFFLQVKVLYVRNLMLTTTEAQIEEAFSIHAPVERVKKIKDYAFVHFGTKEVAHLTMEAMNGILYNCDPPWENHA